MPTVHRYYLPPPAWKPKAKPYASSWHMSAEEAAKRGLTEKDIVPGSAMEVRGVGVQSAGMDGVRTAPK